MAVRKINKKEQDFIDSHYKGVSIRKMVELLYEATGTKVGSTIIGYYYKKKGYKSGVEGKFQKGYEGLSEETKAKIKATQFKDGHISANALPIGTITETRDGYRYIKTDRGWEREHNLVWEKAYGKIPEGYYILHLDRNGLNNNLDNLVLMNKQENLSMLGIGLTYDPDINKAILLTARIKQKVKKYENN